MQKEIEVEFNEIIKISYKNNFFKVNSELTSKCYRIIFTLDVLLSFIPRLNVKLGKDKKDVTYLGKLRALHKHIGSNLKDESLVSIKKIRNTLAHNPSAVVLMFEDRCSSEHQLDQVIEDILKMMSECIDYEDTINEAISNEDPLRESSIFTKQ